MNSCKWLLLMIVVGASMADAMAATSMADHTTGPTNAYRSGTAQSVGCGSSSGPTGAIKRSPGAIVSSTDLAAAHVWNHNRTAAFGVSR
jgi:hypothetical protein